MPAAAPGRAPSGRGGSPGDDATPDRQSERSERHAVAVAPAVLGKNTDSVSPQPRAARSGRYRLRRALRGLQPARAAKCGHCRTGTQVGIGVRDGRARFQGLVRCGLVWLCAVCTATIRARRAEEVSQLYGWHKPHGDTLMLTLTVRHAMGDDLQRIRKGVANAWRALQSGKHWIALKATTGLRGYVRALEVTHGANGWHPHLHVLLLLPPMAPRAIAALRARLSARWQSAVARTLGVDHVPNDHLGCDLRLAHEADYITKLGLEISDMGTKHGRSGNRSPWEIAEDYAAGRDAADGALWRAYAEGMKGARMLTWSKGLRHAAGLGVEPTDEQIVDDEERAAAVCVFMMDSHVWDIVRWGPVERLLEAAETGSEHNVWHALNDLLRQRHSAAVGPP